MKTADREKQIHGYTWSRNRAHGEVGQNRTRSIKWAEKQEKFRPKEMCFFLTSPFIELIGSWLALHHNQKHHTDNGKHSECRFLPIPYLRLPHQKPFAPDIEECHQPHQQARRQRNHGDVQRSSEFGPVRTI